MHEVVEDVGHARQVSRVLENRQSKEKGNEIGQHEGHPTGNPGERPAGYRTHKGVGRKLGGKGEGEPVGERQKRHLETLAHPEHKPEQRPENKHHQRSTGQRMEEEPVRPFPPADLRRVHGHDLLLDAVGDRVAAARNHLVRAPTMEFLQTLRHSQDLRFELGPRRIDISLEMRIALDQLLGGKTRGYGVLEFALGEQLPHPPHRLLDLAVELEGATRFAAVRLPQCAPEKVPQTEPPPAHGGHDRHAQLLRQVLSIYLDAAAHRLVHHVESDDHRPFQLEQLQRQLERTPQSAGIHHVDDEVVVFVEKVALSLTGHLAGGGQGVDAGQVHNLDLATEDQGAGDGEADRRPGEVCGGGTVSGHGVEDGALTGVRLSGKDELHRCSASASLGGVERLSMLPSISTLILDAMPRPRARREPLTSTSTGPRNGALSTTVNQSPMWMPRVLRWARTR